MQYKFNIIKYKNDPEKSKLLKISGVMLFLGIMFYLLILFIDKQINLNLNNLLFSKFFPFLLIGILVIIIIVDNIKYKYKIIGHIEFLDEKIKITDSGDTAFEVNMALDIMIYYYAYSWEWKYTGLALEPKSGRDNNIIIKNNNNNYKIFFECKDIYDFDKLLEITKKYRQEGANVNLFNKGKIINIY